MIRLHAWYPCGDVAEVFEAASFEDLAAQVAARLADPENFRLVVMEDPSDGYNPISWDEIREEAAFAKVGPAIASAMEAIELADKAVASRRLRST